eukprot:CAMPEP_0172587772 /NCGR_PEP_ID=MMETSP1068-20121228/6779_1 /TAXON_ID=35684 /ORGANISM="Pseudopedinella elastica, Strain CCMP716" /LENGTH=70 /DNA_ID=CAMNT_0013382905 /DNA_START=17 /DNA_END=229 /DNA_ORIENTATION=+
MTDDNASSLLYVGFICFAICVGYSGASIIRKFASSIKDIQGATEAQWESEAKSEAARITKERDRAAGAAL